MYRCDCLEPIWPSRHHCLSCHKTFSLKVELERHGDGKCGKVMILPEKHREVGNIIGRNILAKPETSEESCTNQAETVGLESSIKFADICSKFTVENSTKDLVKQIGLLGCDGIPTLVSSGSLHLSDPRLMLVHSRCEETHNALQHKAQEPNVLCVTGVRTPSSEFGCSSSKSPVRFSVSETKETLKVEMPASELLDKKDKGVRLDSPVLEVDKLRVVPESAMRPLEGEAFQILRHLKSSLLDIDAALPEEAFRPSKSKIERRWLWRAFVKSADTIYKMVQALIVFEDTISSDYLSETWWYWASLSAAAKISNLSSLSLRLYSFDAAIRYEKQQKVGVNQTEKFRLSSRAEKKRKVSDV